MEMQERQAPQNTPTKTHRCKEKTNRETGEEHLCSSLVKGTAPKASLCPPIHSPLGHASASGAPPCSASLPKRLALAQNFLQVVKLRAQWRVQWLGGDYRLLKVRLRRPVFPHHNHWPPDRRWRQRQPPDRQRRRRQPKLSSRPSGGQTTTGGCITAGGGCVGETPLTGETRPPGMSRGRVVNSHATPP